VANDKDFIVNNLVEVGGSMKAAIGNSSSAGTVVTGGYSIENGSYDNVSFAVQGTVPLSIQFGDSGTKMYVLMNGQDRVYQYSLSTAYDLSTASYSNLSFGSTSNFMAASPNGVLFNPNGTKMYVVDTGGDEVRQYSLSTAWNVSTASYINNSSLYIGGQDSFPTGIAFNNDGTKIYAVGDYNNTIYQYSLSTAYDVGTGSYDNVSFSVVNEESGAKEMVFNADGTKMFVGGSSETIYQYSLSTAYDISTASYDSISFNLGAEHTHNVLLSGFDFNNDGTKLVAIGSNSVNSVYSAFQYSTASTGAGINLDTSTGNYFTQTLSSDVAFLFSNLSDVQTFQVEVTNSSSSEYKVYWPSSVRFSNGLSLPSPSPSEKYTYTIVANDFGGTNYFVTVNTGP